MSAGLNLASRPFRNERLPRLLLGLAWAGCLVLTALHVLTVRGLLPGQSAARFQEAERLETKLRRVAARAAEPETHADPEQVKLWGALEQLVERRAFSWTGLLARLEQVMPPGVRIVSLAPKPADGRLEVAFEFVGRSEQESLELLRALEARPEFAEVYPLHVEEDAGQRRLRCTMTYEPVGGTQAVAPTLTRIADGGERR